MAKTKTNSVKWLRDVEGDDYTAAHSYLSLIYGPKKVVKILARFRKTQISQFEAKDVFRASRLPLLGARNPHVQKDRKKVMKGKALSPLLLVRDAANGIVIIADGYHRMCAVYGFDEDAVVHCKIV